MQFSQLSRWDTTLNPKPYYDYEPSFQDPNVETEETTNIIPEPCSYCYKLSLQSPILKTKAPILDTAKYSTRVPERFNAGTIGRHWAAESPEPNKPP